MERQKETDKQSERERERERGREGGREEGREEGREGGRERERGLAEGWMKHVTWYLCNYFDQKLKKGMGWDGVGITHRILIHYLLLLLFLLDFCHPELVVALDIQSQLALHVPPLQTLSFLGLLALLIRDFQRLFPRLVRITLRLGAADLHVDPFPWKEASIAECVEERSHEVIDEGFLQLSNMGLATVHIWGYWHSSGQLVVTLGNKDSENQLSPIHMSKT